MADFGYWSWPLDLVGSYEQIRREIKDIEIPFRDKRKQVLWRGAVKTNTQREELMRVVEGKDWADVKDIGWKGSTEVKAGDVGEAMSIPDHCLYQFVLQTEGRLCCRLMKKVLSTQHSRSQLLRARKVPP